MKKKLLSLALILIMLTACFCVSPLAYQEDKSLTVSEQQNTGFDELPEQYGLNGLSETVVIELPYGIETSDLDVETPVPVNGTYEKNKYASTRGYESLSQRDNPEGCRLLYQAFVADMEDFALSTSRSCSTSTISGTVYYYTKVFNLSNYGSMPVSMDDAMATYSLFRDDNPQYYWLSGTILKGQFLPSGALAFYPCVDPLYDTLGERSTAQTIINKGIAEYNALVKGMTSPYDIAKAVHDKIASSINYSYNSSKKPETSLWAHNVVGVLEKRGAVCEGYAKTYQLILNGLGVENTYVVGYTDTRNPSGTGHAWNMVKF